MKEIPAFPTMIYDGLTKREYFAAMAMSGMLANGSLSYGMDFEVIAAKAVTCADELLKQLEHVN